MTFDEAMEKNKKFFAMPTMIVGEAKEKTFEENFPELKEEVEDHGSCMEICSLCMGQESVEIEVVEKHCLSKSMVDFKLDNFWADVHHLFDRDAEERFKKLLKELNLEDSK